MVTADASNVSSSDAVIRCELHRCITLYKAASESIKQFSCYSSTAHDRLPGHKAVDQKSLLQKSEKKSLVTYSKEKYPRK